jgi:uncharacterized protein YheU (UPF0270 family)
MEGQPYQLCFALAIIRATLQLHVNLIENFILKEGLDETSTCANIQEGVCV